MLVCLMLSQRFLRVILFFKLFFSFSAWVPLLFQFSDLFFHFSGLLLNPSCIFQFSNCILFHSVTSICYFLMFSVSLLKFSLWSIHSSIPSLVNIRMTNILNPLSAKLLIPCYKDFFSKFLPCSFIQDFIPVFPPFCLTLCTCFMY